MIQISSKHWNLQFIQIYFKLVKVLFVKSCSMRVTIYNQFSSLFSVPMSGVLQNSQVLHYNFERSFIYTNLFKNYVFIISIHFQLSIWQTSGMSFHLRTIFEFLLIHALHMAILYVACVLVGKPSTHHKKKCSVSKSLTMNKHFVFHKDYHKPEKCAIITNSLQYKKS